VRDEARLQAGRRPARVPHIDGIPAAEAVGIEAPADPQGIFLQKHAELRIELPSMSMMPVAF